MIILYGGSFNPPTLAHYEISKYLIDRYHPKEFVFVPVGSYYKKPNVASFEDRMNMLKILAQKLQSAYVSDFEDSMTAFKGTITTLEYYQSKYPEEKIYFVIGADNLMSLDKWMKIEEMLSKYYFIVLNRNQLDVMEFIKTNDILKKYQDRFFIEENFPTINLSATMYRENNRDDVVLQEINDYIYQHKLYNRGVCL